MESLTIGSGTRPGTRHGASRHAKRGLSGVVALLLTFLLIGPTALAVHDDGTFELDGDASASAAPGDDWSGVFDSGDHSVASAFVADPAAGDATYFKGGGSKDDLTISKWEHSPIDGTPDKDDITNAYAAGYVDHGDLIVYFGADRFSNDGDSQIGFWFFQELVAPIADGNFSGTHQVGDVLVLSDFTNGGAISTIKVYGWVGSGGSDGALDLIGSGTDCDAVGAGDDLCAVVNDVPRTAPWAYVPKPNVGSPGTFPTGAFYEGGINISELLGSTPCITSFLAETRTSQSVDARLKDFAAGSFPLCGISVSKTGDARSKIGDVTRYTITVTNTGAVTLYKESIVDDILGDLTDGSDANVTSTTCGVSLAPGASCAIQLSHTVPQEAPDPLVNRVDVTYDNKVNLSGTDVSDSDTHTTNLFQPHVVVRKGGDAQSKVGDSVHYTFEIENTSSNDSPDLIMDSITDTLLGNLADDAPATCDRLAPGETCDFTADRVVQAGDPNPLPNTVTVHYHPEGFPNDITDSDDHSVELFGPSVTITKGGDTLGKVTDPVHYTFEIENTSSANSPDLILDSVVDSLLGDLEPAANAAGCATLSPGEKCDFTADRVVQAGDPDPLPNTVTVHYHPLGFPNDITSSDDHAVNLFQPGVTVEKSGPATVTVGQPLTYTFTITNTSSSDSPPLDMESMTDVGDGWDGLGVLTDEATAAGCGTLAPGASCTFQVTITAPASPDPLANTVSVLYHPGGFPNDITASDTHSTRLIVVLPRKLARTGSDLATYLALGIALSLAGLGMKFLWYVPGQG